MKRGGYMPFEIIRNDITLMQVDAIVNTANPKVQIGAGVDSAIHKKAGEQLLEARRKIGEMRITEVAVTDAYHLPAKYVLHVVGPIWRGGTENEEHLLMQCYENVLLLAKKLQCESIAIPLISSGSYGFPKQKALHIAVKSISRFLMEHDMQVYLVVFGNEAVALSEKLFQEIKSYIDENYVDEKLLEEYSRVCETGNYRIHEVSDDYKNTFQRRLECDESCSQILSDFVPSKKPLHNYYTTKKRSQVETKTVSNRKLEDLMKELEESFSEYLLDLIDRKGLKDPEVYKKANIDRKLFSKIRNNTNYQPKKSTAVALAIALELNLDETRDLLGKAGYVLSHSSKSDVIVEYFIEHRNYDIFELNEVLFAFGLPILT